MALKKTISYRWMTRGFVMIAAVLLVAAIGFIAVVYNYYYTAVESVLQTRAELYARSAVLSEGNADSWSKAAFTYATNFDNKEQMELQVLSSKGVVLASSTGFLPGGTNAVRDFWLACNTVDGQTIQTGRTETGEAVMALTVAQIGVDDTVIGALRYVVSMKLVNRQILLVALLILGVMLVILFFTALVGLYLIRSIVRPVKDIGKAARRIAKGEYDYRLKKYSQDEIGELCDIFNYMAEEIHHGEQLKNDFISAVSHELRTPLTAIRGWSETLQQMGAEDPELMEKGMQIIADETDRLSEMVEELLDFSRMQNGRLALQFDHMDVTAVLEETVFLFRDRAAKKGVILQYVGQGELPSLWGDAGRLRQVFINVLDNAIKYSETGDTVRVDHALARDGVQVVIGDTGSGIKPGDMPLVKQKFYKGDTTRPGSGIGLAVADEIITGHGGTLELHSKEGVGTSVIITLPLKVRRQESERN